MSMLNALYVTRNDEGPEFEERVTAALRSAHLRRLPVAKAVAGVRPDTAPDLIVAGLASMEPLCSKSRDCVAGFLESRL